MFNGRYGPYVKHGKVNASLPKDAAIEEFTLEQAVDVAKSGAIAPFVEI